MPKLSREEIESIANKLTEMDDAGRAAAMVAIDVLHARSQFGEENNERKEEEGSASQRVDGTSA